MELLWDINTWNHLGGMCKDTPPSGFEDLEQAREILDALIHYQGNMIIHNAIDAILLRITILTDRKHAGQYLN